MGESYRVRGALAREEGGALRIIEHVRLDLLSAVQTAKAKIEDECSGEARIFASAGRLVLIVRGSGSIARYPIEGEEFAFYPVDMTGPEALVFSAGHVQVG